ncbi:MAG: DNA polymerase III subunit beta [Verrucomicrobia bacterium]|nr:DNA polymerase III subunit beta [Verrucomicrobiota bacterium]
MKVIISRLELVGLIGKIQSVVSAKPAIPILANVLIEAIDDELIISATDLTVSMRLHAAAKVLEEGAITLPARRFFQLIRELTAPQVEIHTQSPELATIHAGSSHFKIHGMHKTEFPAMPDLSEGMQFSIPCSELKALLSRSAFAAARDDSRQAINGLLLQSIDQTALFVATDGKRLAKIHTQVASDQNGSYIIPLKAVEEMVRILDVKEDGPCKVTLMPDKIGLEVQSTILISKLLSGQYPDVLRIIPKPSEQPISLHREEMIALLRQVALFAPEHNSSVRLSFTPGELHLSATSGEIGEGKVHMPVNYSGEKLDIAFNPANLLDILRHIQDETVNLSVTNSYNPGLITDSSTAEFVIMPMRLDV